MPGCEFVPKPSDRHSGPCARNNKLRTNSSGASVCIFHCERHEDPLKHQGADFLLFWNELAQEILIAQNAQSQIHDKSTDFRGIVFPGEVEPARFQAVDYTLTNLDFSHCEFPGHFRTLELKTNNCSFAWSRFAADFCHKNLKSGVSLDLSYCTFYGKVELESCSLAGCVKFVGAKFNFDHARFDHSEIWQADFTNAEFTRGARFQQTSFNEGTLFNFATFGIKPGSMLAADFQNTKFNGDISFFKTKFLGIMSLDSAKVQKTSDFRHAFFEIAPSVIGTDLSDSASFEKSEFHRITKQTAFSDQMTFRKLKKVMEDQHNYWQATIFFGYELTAQRNQHSFWENCLDLNYVYCGMSGYGRRWWQPLALLAGSWALFWLLYWLFIGVTVRGSPEFEDWEIAISQWGTCAQAALFSLQNVKLSWLFGQELVIARSPGVFGLSVVQSIISIFLIAISIFHMRRRFRIQ